MSVIDKLIIQMNCLNSTYISLVNFLTHIISLNLNILSIGVLGFGVLVSIMYLTKQT